MIETQELNVAQQFGRVKGAEWFPLLYKRDVMVLGQGGISSWVTLLLSRIGCNLYTYDMDFFEPHNLTGQFAAQSSIGKNKAEAIKDLIKDFSPECEIETYGQYKMGGEVSDIMICGFDNMKARKLAFEKWRESCDNNSFFQDGRLLAEQLQIFNIPGNRKDLIDRYEEYLFDDSEVEEQDCTFKQTSHCAAMIASHMVAFLTNWATNCNSPYRNLPFFYEYSIPVNLTTCET